MKEWMGRRRKCHEAAAVARTAQEFKANILKWRKQVISCWLKRIHKENTTVTYPQAQNKVPKYLQQKIHKFKEKLGKSEIHFSEID